MTRVKGIYEKVFRAKWLSETQPRIGSPTSIEPGDWLLFFLDGAFTGRVVTSMHQRHCITKPISSEDGSYKVKFADFHEATRRIGDAPPEPEPVPEKPKPKTKPKTKPKAKAKPKTKPKPKRKRARRKPPAFMAGIVDSKYDD